MTEKDDIIENHEPGKKPRRKLKAEEKQKTLCPFLQEGFKCMFDPKWIDMTVRRITNGKSKGYFGSNDVQNWHDVASFHYDVVGTGRLLVDLVKPYDTQQRDHIEINNPDHLEKYVFINHSKSYLARIFEPEMPDNFFAFSNDDINKTIEDFQRSETSGLTLIALDEFYHCQNKAWHVPFFRDDDTVPERLQNKPGHIITLSYLPEDKTLNVDDVQQYDRDKLLGVLRETLGLPGEKK